MDVFAWLGRQFQKFEQFPAYGNAISKEWMSILFGEGVLAVIFLIWWALGTPPLVLIFVAAVLVAGYYAWRAIYVNSIPKFAVRRFLVTETPTIYSGEMRKYVHLVPECLTDAPVHECQGFLLRVLKKSEEKWIATAADEPLDLTWSIQDRAEPRTLQPGVLTRLNLLYISNYHCRLSPCTPHLPYRFTPVFDTAGAFRFDVRFTARDCPPVDVAVEIHTVEAQDTISVQLLDAQQ